MKKFPSFKSAPKANAGNASLVPTEEKSASPIISEYPIIVNEERTSPYYTVDRRGDFDCLKVDGRPLSRLVCNYERYTNTLLAPGQVEWKVRTSKDDPFYFYLELKKAKSSEDRHSRIPFQPDCHGSIKVFPRNDFSDASTADFIEIMAEDGPSLYADKDNIKLDMSEEELSLKKRITQNPQDVDAWKQLIHLQDKGTLKQSTGRLNRALAQRKVAIYEGALRANPDHYDLLMEYLELQSLLLPPEDINELWRVICRRFPTNWDLRLAQQRHLLNDNFVAFTIEETLEAMKQLLIDFHARSMIEERDLQLARIIHFLNCSGHFWYALEIVYANMYCKNHTNRDDQSYISSWKDILEGYRLYLRPPPSSQSSWLNAERLAEEYHYIDLDEYDIEVDDVLPFVFHDLSPDLLIEFLLIILKDCGVLFPQNRLMKYDPSILFSEMVNDECWWNIDLVAFRIKPIIMTHCSVDSVRFLRDLLLNMFSIYTPSVKEKMFTILSQMTLVCASHREENVALCKEILRHNPENLSMWLDFVYLTAVIDSAHAAKAIFVKIVKSRTMNLLDQAKALVCMVHLLLASNAGIEDVKALLYHHYTAESLDQSIHASSPLVSPATLLKMKSYYQNLNGPLHVIFMLLWQPSQLTSNNLVGNISNLHLAMIHKFSIPVDKRALSKTVDISLLSLDQIVLFSSLLGNDWLYSEVKARGSLLLDQTLLMTYRLLQNPIKLQNRIQKCHRDLDWDGSLSHLVLNLTPSSDISLVYDFCRKFIWNKRLILPLLDNSAPSLIVEVASSMEEKGINLHYSLSEFLH